MIRFVEHDHSYWLADQRIPGVTEILKPLYDFTGIDPAVIERKSKLGQAVHRATELYDADDLDPDSLSQALLPYLDAWIRFRADTGFAPTMSEQRVFHKTFCYAGTLDRTGYIKGRLAVLDIKTTVELSPAVGCQLAAYQEALRSAELCDPTERYAIQLRPDGTYKLQRYTGADEWPTFLSLLTVGNFKRRHNL